MLQVRDGGSLRVHAQVVEVVMESNAERTLQERDDSRDDATMMKANCYQDTNVNSKNAYIFAI